MSRVVRVLAGTVGASRLTPSRVRIWMWNAAGNRIDASASIRAGSLFRRGHLSIGPGVVIGDQTLFEDFAPVTIERNVYMASRCTILTQTHLIDYERRDLRAGTWLKHPVTISEGCWLGAAVTVLPGVTIAAGCVVAAGSVVTSDTEPNGLYAGTPAVRKRDL